MRLARVIGKWTALLVVGAIGTTASPAEAARLIRVTVSVDGTKILEGITSDDGRVDADGVWIASKTVKLKAVGPNLREAKVGEELVLTSDAPVGEPGRVVFDVRYGGRAEVRTLRLIRVPPGRDGYVWSIHPEEVEDNFDRRLIRRSSATGLGPRPRKP